MCERCAPECWKSPSSHLNQQEFSWRATRRVAEGTMKRASSKLINGGNKSDKSMEVSLGVFFIFWGQFHDVTCLSSITLFLNQAEAESTEKRGKVMGMNLISQSSNWFSGTSWRLQTDLWMERVVLLLCAVRQMGFQIRAEFWPEHAEMIRWLNI